MIRRRDFLTLVGSAAEAWPFPTLGTTLTKSCDANSFQHGVGMQR